MATLSLAWASGKLQVCFCPTRAIHDAPSFERVADRRCSSSAQWGFDAGKFDHAAVSYACEGETFSLSLRRCWC